ncbi:hypothetical protein ACIQ7D_06785 [Streptomyces sp. NPDC096310]|uniref:hypothetical protein n=1 Tax=Streptomyces sp. NPDC096310 TaxID=3366082 RepID=UPI0037FD298E
MITHSDEGPEFEPDDPLTVILRPSTDHLGPPPGRYEAIRRTAARRRLVRAAVGVGVSCAVVTLVVLPLRYAAETASTSPTAPLAPPPASSPPPAPTPPAEPTSASSPGPEPTGEPPSGGRPPGVDATTEASTSTGAPSLAPPAVPPPTSPSTGATAPDAVTTVDPTPKPGS